MSVVGGHSVCGDLLWQPWDADTPPISSRDERRAKKDVIVIKSLDFGVRQTRVRIPAHPYTTWAGTTYFLLSVSQFSQLLSGYLKLAS